MTTELETEANAALDSATTLPRFPGDKVGRSLLSIVNSPMEGVVFIDATRHIVLVNRRIESMFGYSARQLLDKPLDVLLPAQNRTEQQRLERLTSVRVHGKRARLALRGRRASGQEFPVSAAVSRIILHGELFLAIVLKDLKVDVHRGTRAVEALDLRRLAVSSQQANEVEKRRFSRELYDNIGQRLSVLKLDLDWLESSLSHKQDDCLPERVAHMQGMLDKVITLTKSMASALRPPLLDDFGLIPALEWMANNFHKKTNIACAIRYNRADLQLQEPVESAVFRVVQESLLNVEKHAGANKVEVLIDLRPDRIELTIRDDGTGMVPGSESKPGCYGLIVMQERIFILGGTISIQNAKPRGLVIHAWIPLEPLPV